MTATTTSEGTGRRRELLDVAYRRVLDRGGDDLDPIPPAEGIGTTPAELATLFGDRDGLVRALLARARTDQLRALDALPDEAGLVSVAEALWRVLAAPSHRGVGRLWLQAYSRSVGDPTGPWAGFAAQTVTDWDLLLAAHQPTLRGTTPAGVAERVLVLAVLRGALLDLLATGDDARAGVAVRAHLDALGRRSGAELDDRPRTEGAGGSDPDGE